MSGLLLKTGLKECFDAAGGLVRCSGSGQDAEFRIGREIPVPRFIPAGEGLVRDEYTGLVWPRGSDVFDFPLTWAESLQMIESLNKEAFLGRNTWRMPDRRELRSLIDHGSRMPAMPGEHPFFGFRESWYWTGTSSAMYTDYAWYIHFAGGRMFWGRKDQQAFCRPVSGRSKIILPTGQSTCLDSRGKEIRCSGIYALADRGHPLDAKERFRVHSTGVEDGLTGLLWHVDPFLDSREVKWQKALDMVDRMNSKQSEVSWRLPNINELESIVDCSRHTPALSLPVASEKVQEVYWSSSTSGYETDWAFALYMHKGAVGVGHKSSAAYAVWPVAGDPKRLG
ncbi:MAG: DUF1566 domain-containing protein [Desulfonatronovibrionaceae bacterium]